MMQNSFNTNFGGGGGGTQQLLYRRIAESHSGPLVSKTLKNCPAPYGL